MLFTTLVTVIALCLFIPFTRMYGVIGAGLLFWLYPFVALGILLVAGIAYYFFFRRNSHVSKLPF